MSDELEPLFALIRRELGATDVRLLSDEAEQDVSSARLTSDECEIRWPLPAGGDIVVRFEAVPLDRESKLRRLEMLASTFDFAGPARDERGDRPNVARALHEELTALRERAGAVNALVIDANSPVIWGAARAPAPKTKWLPAPGSQPPPPLDAPPRDPAVDSATYASVDAARALSERGLGRKGKHVRHVSLTGEAKFLAHSFAGIYLLLVVFAEEFDELRTERVTLELLPRIERLVLALPPMDPPPPQGAGAVVRLRRR